MSEDAKLQIAHDILYSVDRLSRLSAMHTVALASGDEQEQSEYADAMGEERAVIEARLAGLTAEVERLKGDADRYAYIRDLACNSMHLSRNDEQAPNYITAAQHIESQPDWFQDDDPAEVERMKATNTIWTLHVYPNHPVTFWVRHAATLDTLIDDATRGDA